MVSSSVNLFGKLRTGSSWTDYKSQLLSEYFPNFVRERMIRDLVIFNFHGEGQALRAYIEQVFAAAKFLHYDVSEQDLVDRVVMNFQPSVLSHAAFVDRPCTLKELYKEVGIVEEKLAVAQERQRLQLPYVNIGNPMGVPCSGPVRAAPPMKCWKSGDPSRIRRDCPRTALPPGNGQTPGGRLALGRRS